MWAEKAVRAEAASQHGLVDRPTLIGLGIVDDQIQAQLKRARISQIHPGVYYLNVTPPTWKTDVLAGVLAAGPDALASHRCAGVLWGLDAVYGRLIEATVPYEESPEPVGVVLHRTRRPNPADRVDGIPVTAVEKTLLDLARLLPTPTLYKATVSALHNGLTTPAKLDLAVGAYGGRGVSGTRKFRAIVRAAEDDVSASVSEIDLKEIIHDAPIPQPVQQLKVALGNGSNAYPDFAWSELMRIVEADSVLAHASPEQLQTDLSRQNRLMDLGWESRRFTAAEIRDDPQQVRSEVIHFINKPVL